MARSSCDRRRFLRGAGIAGLAATSAGLLGACTSDDRPSATASSSTPDPKVLTPTYARFQGPAPDLAGDGQHVPDAYFTYPTDPAVVSKQPPGDGSRVVAATLALGGAPKPVSSNSYWQELNERLGVELDYQVAIGEDNQVSKIATLVAGGDIPDIVQIPSAVGHLGSMLEAKFADLTDYLAGDAVHDYPALANLPEHVWQQSIHGGRIRGIKTPLYSWGSLMLANRGILNGLGVSVDDVTDAASFASICKEVTNAKGSQWALTNPLNTVRFICEMLGQPCGNLNYWSEEDGKFIFSRETDEYRQALSFVKELWSAGVYHPDSFGLTGSNEIQEFNAERIVFDWRGGNQWAGRYPEGPLHMDVTATPVVSFDGSGVGVKELGPGTYHLTAFNKDLDPERLQMLLRIADWMAIPFGTEEYLFRNYGIEGVHYTMESDGEPVTNDMWREETRLPNGYIMAAPPELFVPGVPEGAREIHGFIQKFAPTGRQSAVLGLWSETYSKAGAGLETTLLDTISGYFRGEYTLDDFDAALDEWRAGGGDEIRAEYEAEFAARAEV